MDQNVAVDVRGLFRHFSAALWSQEAGRATNTDEDEQNLHGTSHAKTHVLPKKWNLLTPHQSSSAQAHPNATQAHSNAAQALPNAARLSKSPDKITQTPLRLAQTAIVGTELMYAPIN